MAPAHQLVARVNSVVGTNNPLTPPPGYAKLGINGDSRGWQVVVSSSVTIAVAFTALIARLAAKLFVSKAAGWEDIFCVVGFLFALARVVCNFILVDWYQMGYHIWDVDTAFFEPSLVVYKVGYLLYLPAILFVKLSLILLYIRLFRAKILVRWICYALTVIVVGYTVSLWLAILFECIPFEAGWTFNILGRCASLTHIDYAMGAFNIFTDAALLILPLPIVIRLNMPFRKMLAYVAVFSTGTLVLAVSIVREVLVVQTVNTFDTNWSSVDDLIWLTVEVNVGIVCACLPLIPPLFTKNYLQSKIINGFMSVKTMLSLPRSRRSSDDSEQGKQTMNLASRKTSQQKLQDTEALEMGPIIGTRPSQKS